MRLISPTQAGLPHALVVVPVRVRGDSARFATTLSTSRRIALLAVRMKNQ